MEFPVTFENVLASEAATRKVFKRGHVLVDELNRQWVPGAGGVYELTASGAVPGRDRSNIWSRKVVGSGLGASGTTVHRTVTQVPFGGQWVEVALEFFNDVVGTPNIVEGAYVASSSTYTADVPDGAYISLGGLTVPSAISTTRLSYLQTPWVRVYVTPDSTNPLYGNIYSLSRFTSGGRFFGAITNTLYDTVDTGVYKSRFSYNALTNILDPYPASPLGPNMAMRSSILLVRPLTSASAMSIAHVGDSRSSGQGSTSDFYGTFTRAAETVAADGARYVGHENHGWSGMAAFDYTNLITARLATRTLDLLHYQPASSNDFNPWTTETTDLNIARTALIAAECKRRGIVFTTETMYPSTQANTAAKVAEWRRLNAHIRATYPNVVDFERSALTVDNGVDIPTLAATYQFDTQHRNDAGHAYSSGLVVPVWRRALGLV